MNKNWQLLIQLQELTLLRKGIGLVGHTAPGENLDSVDQRINKVRRQLPGLLLSHFDKLMRQYPDAIAVLSGQTCSSCHQEISPRLASQIENSREPLRCDHCDRFLIPKERVPDYVTFV